MPNTPRSKTRNSLALEFPSLSANTNVACAAISAFAEQMNPSVEDLSNITTAVSEAVENAIIHAYPDALGMIHIKATRLNGNMLEIKVTDRGRGIKNVEEARKPCFTTGGMDCAGMGFTIMETFMTTMRVSSTPGKGTIVTMKYHISQK